MEEQQIWEDNVINQRGNKHVLSKVSALDLAWFFKTSISKLNLQRTQAEYLLQTLLKVYCFLKTDLIK